MPVFLCTYHVRTTFQKVICQKISRACHNQQDIHAMYAELKAIMYCVQGRNAEESLAAASAMARAFQDKWHVRERALVAHFETHWEPKLGAFPMHCW